MAKTEKKQRHWLSHLSFGTVSLVLSALLVLAYLSVVVDPAKAWFFTLFGLLYPLVLPATVLLFVWSLLRLSHMRLLLALVLLPSLFVFGRYVQIRRSTPTEEGPLKVVSYNVGLFAHGPAGSDRLVLADSVSRWLRAQDADLICLQEFYLPADVSMDTWIKRHFPGYKAEYYIFPGTHGAFGNLTLSRKPVVDKGIGETFQHRPGVGALLRFRERDRGEDLAEERLLDDLAEAEADDEHDDRDDDRRPDRELLHECSLIHVLCICGARGPPVNLVS